MTCHVPWFSSPHGKNIKIDFTYDCNKLFVGLNWSGAGMSLLLVVFILKIYVIYIHFLCFHCTVTDFRSVKLCNYVIFFLTVARFVIIPKYLTPPNFWAYPKTGIWGLCVVLFSPVVYLRHLSIYGELFCCTCV